MLLKKCKFCGNIFDRPFRSGNGYVSRFKISWSNYKNRMFCSSKCKGKWSSICMVGEKSSNYRGGKTKCINCGKLLPVRYSYRNTLRCRKCYYKFIKASPSNHPNWKGGRFLDKNGYYYIKLPEHPFSNNNGYIFEHRIIAEKILNRYLTKSEIIHHINGIKNDNRPENLYLFSSSSKHRTFEGNKNLLPELKSNLF